MAARGNDRQAARTRARERRLALDADRRQRDERLDEAVADFELSAMQRMGALSAVAAAELVMGAAVAALLAEGETVERAAALCGTAPAEIRRLARLARSNDAKSRTRNGLTDAATSAA